MDKKRLKYRNYLHIAKNISKISTEEDLIDLIQKQILPALGTSIWIWYWQSSKQSPLQLISIVTPQNYYSKFNTDTLPDLNTNEWLIADNISLISSNEHFDHQHKTNLLRLLKEHSNSNKKEFFNIRYKAIIQAPEMINFSVLGLTKFAPRDYRLIEIIAPIILVQKQNLIRNDMSRHYRTLFNELSGEHCLALLDPAFQVIDCTHSFKNLFAEDFLFFYEFINQLLGLGNHTKSTKRLELMAHIESVCQCGRRTYEVSIKAVYIDYSEEHCFWSLQLNRLFNEENHGLRKLRDAGLTPREVEICSSVSKGNSNGDIAIQLNISLYTVKNHIKNIFAKMKVSSRLELAKFLCYRGKSNSDPL